MTSTRTKPIRVFQVATGTKLVHVPYKGGGLALVDLVAGQIDMVLSDMAPACRGRRIRS